MYNITNKPIGHIARVYQDQNRVKPNEAAKSTAPASGDKVTLSATGREINALMKKVENTPDIRPEAESIKQAVKSGRYDVSGEEIASSILKTLE